MVSNGIAFPIFFIKQIIFQNVLLIKYNSRYSTPYRKNAVQFRDKIVKIKCDT